jgi:hypothetical protein
MQVTLSPDVVAAIVMAFCGAMISWLGYLHTQVGWIRVTLAETRLENKTLWDFQLRRGALEAIGNGVATKNSPLTVREEYLAVSKELGEPLREFYRKLGRPAMTNAELAFQIERHFGSRIVDNVCVPLGLSYGACLIIASAIAKGNAVVDV